MVTIQNLEVRFEVDGDDRAQFGRLFAEYIRRYEQEAAARKARADRAERDRRLDAPGGHPWT